MKRRIQIITAATAVLLLSGALVRFAVLERPDRDMTAAKRENGITVSAGETAGTADGQTDGEADGGKSGISVIAVGPAAREEAKIVIRTTDEKTGAVSEPERETDVELGLEQVTETAGEREPTQTQETAQEQAQEPETAGTTEPGTEPEQDTTAAEPIRIVIESGDGSGSERHIIMIGDSRTVKLAEVIGASGETDTSGGTGLTRIDHTLGDARFIAQESQGLKFLKSTWNELLAENEARERTEGTPETAGPGADMTEGATAEAPKGPADTPAGPGVAAGPGTVAGPGSEPVEGTEKSREDVPEEDAIVIWLGINDIYNADSYVSEINTIAEQAEGEVFAVEVTPVSDYASTWVKNDEIVGFNQKLRDGLRSDVTLIPMYDTVKGFGEGIYDRTGIHYDTETTNAIWDRVCREAGET